MLDSISHEFRTPIALIPSASNALNSCRRVVEHYAGATKPEPIAFTAALAGYQPAELADILHQCLDRDVPKKSCAAEYFNLRVMTAKHSNCLGGTRREHPDRSERSGKSLRLLPTAELNRSW